MVAIPPALASMAVDDADPARYAIGGRPPEWIVAPRSAAEAVAVRPRGGRWRDGGGTARQRHRARASSQRRRVPSPRSSPAGWEGESSTRRPT